jgi:hypothetical protein
MYGLPRFFYIDLFYMRPDFEAKLISFFQISKEIGFFDDFSL